MIKMIFKKTNFRVERFEKNVSRQMSSLLFSHYNLEVVVSYVHASADLRSARIYLYRPLRSEKEKQVLEKGLRDLFVLKHSAEEWVKFFSIEKLNVCILKVLQLYNKDIAHNLAQKMRFRYIPELFFKFDKTYFPGEEIVVAELEEEEVHN